MEPASSSTGTPSPIRRTSLELPKVLRKKTVLGTAGAIHIVQGGAPSAWVGDVTGCNSRRPTPGSRETAARPVLETIRGRDPDSRGKAAGRPLDRSGCQLRRGCVAVPFSRILAKADAHTSSARKVASHAGSGAPRTGFPGT
jgi:hypothetical protein